MTCVTIWGNHSNTQYPDFTNAKIKGKPATEVITDRNWLENTFVPQCQNRGAAVIKARGLQLGAVGRQRGHRPRQEPAAGRRRPTTGSARPWCRRGEYGVPPGLVFSYPCRSDGKGNFTVVEGVKLDAFGQAEVPGDAEGTGGGAGDGGGVAEGVAICRSWLLRSEAEGGAGYGCDQS